MCNKNQVPATARIQKANQATKPPNAYMQQGNSCFSCKKSKDFKSEWCL